MPGKSAQCGHGSSNYNGPKPASGNSNMNGSTCTDMTCHPEAGNPCSWCAQGVRFR